MEFRRLLLVCLGGAVGSGLRYLTSVALAPKVAGGFPANTLVINVLGCFCLELLLTLATGTTRVSTETRLLLGTGLLGGFTTYSTFNTESLALFRQGSAGLGAAYVAATVLLGLGAGLLGAVVGRSLAPALGSG